MSSVLVVNDDEDIGLWVGIDFTHDSQTIWDPVVVCTTMDDLSAKLASSDLQTGVAMVDVRLGYKFGGYTGFDVAKKLLERGFKVSLTSVLTSPLDKQKARDLGVPIFNTLDLLNDGIHNEGVLRYIATETLAYHDDRVRRENES